MTFSFFYLQENGHSSMYTWILSTGWWKTRAPINPDAVVVVGLLCTCLLGGFIYINRSLFCAFHMCFGSLVVFVFLTIRVLNVCVSIALACRVKSSNTIKQQPNQSVKLILVLASLYCLWCVSQIYWVNPRRPAVGEEADLGVFVFLATYLFLPHYLCILSTHPRDLEAEQIPL